MNKDRLFRLPSFIGDTGEALLVQDGSRRVSPLAVAILLYSSMAGYTFGDAFEDRNQINTETAYEKQFINNDGCLDDTPFDPENGAVIVLRDVNGSETITVIPQSPESFTPAVLNLQQGSENELTFAGNITGGFLAENCDITGGY